MQNIAVSESLRNGNKVCVTRGRSCNTTGTEDLLVSRFGLAVFLTFVAGVNFGTDTDTDTGTQYRFFLADTDNAISRSEDKISHMNRLR